MPEPRHKTNRPGQWIALAITLLFAVLQAFEISHVENPFSAFVRDHVESRTLDLRFALRGKMAPPDSIVIVAVDEKSLEEIGRWPWTRTKIAKLIDKVSETHPLVIGLDMFFSESESPEADAALGEALARSGRVVMAATFLRGGSEVQASNELLPIWLEDSGFPKVVNTELPGIIRGAVSISTLDVIGEGCAAHGHAVVDFDRDGVTRKEILALGYGIEDYPDVMLPSLALQVARIAKEQDIEFDGMSGVRFGDQLFTTDPNARVTINWYGPNGTITTYSAYDVMQGSVPPEKLKGKIVYVGTSAVQTFDPVATPFTPRMPGVEKNATVTANLLGGGFIRKGYGLVELLVILLGGIALSIVLPRMKAVKGGFLATVLVIGYFAVIWFAFKEFRYALDVVYPVGTLVSVYASVAVAGFISEERRAKEIRSLFQSYVSPKIVHEILKHPDKVRVGGERKTVTVLFSDVRGFTTFSEKNTPEEIVDRLNELLSAMTQIIFHWDGTLDKFVGDEIMSFWGAPLDQPDHAARAVNCALEMQERLAELAVQWENSGKEVLRMGIGLNTGEAVVGNIGALGQKMDYTLIGDAVNTGARIESLTRKFDAEILVSQGTVDLVRSASPDLASHVVFQHLGSVPVKGKSREVSVYSVRRSDEMP